MKFLHFEEIDSTNKYAKENFATLENFTVIYTDRQTAGRGRLQRGWNYIGNDNIYATIVIKPEQETNKNLPNLTQYLCIVLAEVFEEYGVQPQIKWPNDIRINKKKISGILAEGVIEKGQLKGIALGVGINLNCEKSELEKINQPATSLNIELNKKIDKEIFLKKLINNFCLRYNRFIEEGFLLIREDYKKRAEFLDMPITVRLFDKDISGTVLDITEDGALKLEDKNKNKHIILIGDIL